MTSLLMTHHRASQYNYLRFYSLQVLPMFNRRAFFQIAAAGAAGMAVSRVAGAADTAAGIKISLAQWSHNKAFFGRTGVAKKDPFRFAEIAVKDYGINGVEYVNQFYKDKKADDAYLKDLRKIADDNQVTSVLIMCDGEGDLGDADAAKRSKAVDHHKRWLEWAKYLGCHSIRVNAKSAGSYDDQIKLAAEGLRKLSEVAAAHKLNVIVENHGGLSSNGAWLPNCGTLPDFGNFTVRNGEVYDRYKGVDELMPYAKGVSAKSHDFDADGNETHTDYKKMMDIVIKKHKYSGWVGIEYEGSKLPEADGIKATLKLLQKCLKELA
jgi:L-ribulose-5-phosphate 3-epimerase